MGAFALMAHSSAGSRLLQSQAVRRNTRGCIPHERRVDDDGSGLVGRYGDAAAWAVQAKKFFALAEQIIVEVMIYHDAATR